MEKRFQLFLVLSTLVFISTMLYVKQTAPPPPPPGKSPVATGNAATSPTQSEAFPTTATQALAAAPDASPTAPPAEQQPQGPKVDVSTNVYHVVFSTNGAVPVRWDVIGPRKFVTRGNDSAEGTSHPEHLIDPGLADHPNLPRPFQTVLQVLNSRYYREFNTMVFTHRQLDEAGLVHQFTSPANADGVSMVKTFTFEPDSFQVGLKLDVVNGGDHTIVFGGSDRGLGLVVGPGLGGSANGGEEAVERYDATDAVLKTRSTFLYEHFKGIEGSPTGQTQGTEISPITTHGLKDIQWGGVVSKYFMSVILADPANPFASANAFLDNQVVGTLTQNSASASKYPVIELYGAPFTLRPGEKTSFSYTSYLGPMQHGLLKAANHDLVRAMFHSSWDATRALCLFLMTLLFAIHSVIGNWGIAIMALTFLVRLSTLPFVHKGMKSQAKMTQQMAKIKPLLDKINEKYKDDPQRKQQETFKLYREHNINPLGMLKGCGWLMVQTPVLIGLYALLYQVIDLRGASFLWIHDLSEPDHLFHLGLTLPFLGDYFNLLPIITAISQVATSKFMQTPASDPQQQQMQKMMTYMMPVFILVITYRFPSGLMLYWLVSNVWQVAQQIYVNKVIKKPEAAKAAA